MTEQTTPANNSDPSSDPEGGSSKATKTPLFEANHADRYQRQTLINQIQDLYQALTNLLCVRHPGA